MKYFKNANLFLFIKKSKNIVFIPEKNHLRKITKGGYWVPPYLLIFTIIKGLMLILISLLILLLTFILFKGLILLLTLIRSILILILG